MSDVTLQAALSHLVDAELLFQRGQPPSVRYQFKHVLVQDTAYASMLKSRRRQLHAVIGRLLETKFPETVEIEPETLAHHFTMGGVNEIAITHWLRAGRKALSRSAFNDAINLLTKGLALIPLLDGRPERNMTELDFLIPLGTALRATKGFTAIETRRVNLRARDLLGTGSTIDQDMAVMQQLWNGHHQSAEHDVARTVARQHLSVATRQGTVQAMTNAHRSLGITLCVMGAFSEARRHMEQSIRLYETRDPSTTQYHSSNDRVLALAFLSWTLWLLGYPLQALEAAKTALTLARGMRVEDTFATGMALHAHVRLATFGADPEWAAPFTEEMVTHCTRHHLTNYTKWGHFHHGFLLSLRDPMQGEHAMAAALESEGKTAGLYRPQHLGLLSAVKLSLGRISDARCLITEAIERAEQTNEGFAEAELHRLNGTLLLMLGKSDEGETEFKRALLIAREQDARWWELKAATSLGRLWRDQGRVAEAYELLAPIYNSFTEGFDIADLKAAKSLLDEVSSSQTR